VVVPDNLTITVSVGESLFDERFGLAEAKPRHLSRMVGFPNDALEADQCHGDLTLQFCANTPDSNIHALRDIVKNLPDLLFVRWKQEGTVPPQAPAKPGEPEQSARNFLGFRDGSANPDSNDARLMDTLVWVQPGSDEPAWAAHGSYQAVRIIRNFVERWDRTPLQEQENIFGRVKTTGAPMDGRLESDVPDYAKDPEGKLTKLDAHIRLANPRTPESQQNLILRRPFNYSNGVNKNGQLDMGLLFICYQADLEKGFITVQTCLNGEPLEEYLKPVGGGYFFTLPGVTGAQDFIGRSLLDATKTTTTTA
jgi:deferrochelatase/peroxidase EfeB